MDIVIQNFSKNEYLIIFSAFFYGHITTNFFSGWAYWIQYRKSIKFSPDHIVFSALIFFLMIDIWWVAYFRVNNITIGFVYFFISLLTPINLFLLTTTTFPNLKSEGKIDLAGYYHRNERLIYLILALNFVINFVTSTILEGKELYHSENYFRMIAFSVCLAAVVIRRRWFSRALMALGILLLIYHMAVTPQPDNNQSSANFSFISYLTIFTTFIYGFVASLFLRGWSLIIQRFKEVTFSKEHFGWTLLAFCLLIDIWWGSWDREDFIARNLGNYLIFLTTPLAFYILASALFPFTRGQSIDLVSYFNHNRRYLFSLFGLLMLTNFLVANVMEEKKILSQENLLRIAALVMAVPVLASKNVFLHRCVLALAWVLLIVHSVLYG